MKYNKIDFIWKKQHLKRFIIGIAGYSFMMPFTIFIGKKVEAGIFVLTIIAMLPVIPFLLAMSAYIANIKTMDEMWRKIQTNALVMTALITIAFSFSLGMLQIMNIMQSFSIFFLFPFMMIVWAICFGYLITRDKLI